ncbi:MAG: cobalt-precorrin-5B (C(1))-methyltransferase [Rhizobiales bacterium]|nr:cobalt-precorrin-5B (C(1))-methyltransferase [Hyphomicrobiales bacterium]NRB13587.1 cobalt-precorrin-5B (C(1))-methyltransferase [Hyphomicrobiales bacterium]
MNQKHRQNQKQKAGMLKRGWTTGACATAATKSAFTALITGEFLDPVSIILPKGDAPSFALAYEGLGDNFATAAIIKDAGDDPDVTHGALIIAEIKRLKPGLGIIFKAGDGVGTVTRAGLPIEVGQAAINPVPRQLMSDVITQLAKKYAVPADVEICIRIPDGENIAKKTWNPRLGILGGLSILGTTGIVHPFSCSAWIASIHRGVDVARAAGIFHIAGSTGSTSEAAVAKFHNLPEIALMDMGDFVGGLLKYVRHQPVERVTIAGGFAKITKLAMGLRDLHSARGQVDFNWMAAQFIVLGAAENLLPKIKNANTALEVLTLADAHNVDIAPHIAALALAHAIIITNNKTVKIDIVITNRQGDVIAHKEATT